MFRIINPYVLGGAALAFVAVATFAYMKGVEHCDARHERERLKTQEELQQITVETNTATQELIAERESLLEAIEDLENAARENPDTCIPDAGRRSRKTKRA